MTESRNDNESYVQKVSDHASRFTRELLLENKNLRAVAAALESDRNRLQLEMNENAVVQEENLQLRRALEAAQLTADHATGRLRIAEQQIATYEKQRDDLSSRLAQLEEQNRKRLDDYLEVEQQNANLANLYVASYRLHSTLEHEEVLAAIQEIIVNLIGCEELVLAEIEGPRRMPRIVRTMGVDADTFSDLPEWAAARIRACVDSRELWVRDRAATTTDQELTACIPLVVGDRVAGVIAIFRLLQQKPDIEPLDRELFGLLATHAATALYCSRIHEAHLAGVM